MIGDRRQLARFQSDFYRDCYYKALNRIVLSVLVILALILAIIYYILYIVPPAYYGTATSGQIIPMIPQQK